MSASLIVFVLLQLADIITTRIALRLGGHELNPVLAKLFDRFSPMCVLVPYKLALCAMVSWADHSGLLIPGALWVLCLVFGLVVANNLRTIEASR